MFGRIIGNPPQGQDLRQLRIGHRASGDISDRFGIRGSSVWGPATSTVASSTGRRARGVCGRVAPEAPSVTDVRRGSPPTHGPRHGPPDRSLCTSRAARARLGGLRRSHGGPRDQIRRDARRWGVAPKAPLRHRRSSRPFATSWVTPWASWPECVHLHRARRDLQRPSPQSMQPRWADCGGRLPRLRRLPRLSGPGRASPSPAVIVRSPPHGFAVGLRAGARALPARLGATFSGLRRSRGGQVDRLRWTLGQIAVDACRG